MQRANSTLLCQPRSQRLTGHLDAGGYDFLVAQTQDADLGGGVFGSYTWAYRHRQGTTTMDVLAPSVASTPWGHAASTAAGDWIYGELFVNHSP